MSQAGKYGKFLIDMETTMEYLSNEAERNRKGRDANGIRSRRHR